MLIISSFPHTQTHAVCQCPWGKEAGWWSRAAFIDKRWHKQKAGSLFCQVGNQGEATSDECKIYIPTQALLQPKRCTDHSLHTKFHLQSQTGMQNMQTCTHTWNTCILYPAGVNSQRDCFVLVKGFCAMLCCYCSSDVGADAPTYICSFFRIEHLNWIISSYLFRHKCTVHNAVSHELLET